ncbi:MAG: hypothetical protein UR46_C0031G0004 [Parcubacteria group bacterium GW2011_GWA1_33_6]|uniref:Uncharacterized protein n=1 Tax=Candidatus Staskawiczbacteria bacterium RIFCSPHIGHO2_02_FULL_33_16 TaxID=1802204 RepID=A0A1G2HUP5_9BACT|nr:MAG: hypothetical protein UR31_C0019G0024 [Parcubacteria group bacterium GW2011_GWA2_33_14]KKP53963.1 MAG: hypothetical protein UR46_C0031G0004 [Parcubacteria group bacterium GW2011_GWA1_33_6]OGZ65950.1 MAG: hypothetical protein A3D34_01630 [Candidatus Staskawiczbacteria bacterium RIFCSPHIGHO2_02_FULL_33_16]OGZ70553.1 MAG: hypothetical protein A2980_01220 [Candidatus Staskawiczbacteria bacterium RIFCSPLOWO2_01_FULL_33_13]
MKNKNVTIDQLAGMVQKGFNETAKKSEMDLRFKEVNKRFDRIENILIKQHSEEIEYLKKRVGKLEEALAME